MAPTGNSAGIAAEWYGVTIICGTGFRVNFFIGLSGFGEMESAKVFDERRGIVIGSLCFAVAGYRVLRYATARYPKSKIA